MGTCDMIDRQDYETWRFKQQQLQKEKQENNIQHEKIGLIGLLIHEHRRYAGKISQQKRQEKQHIIVIGGQ